MKKINFNSLNYKDLDHFAPHDIKRDDLHNFYLTFDFLNLIKKWPEIVGEKLASVTSPLRLRGQTLMIVTKHSIYSQELSFLGETIKKEIFKFFPELKSIIEKINFQTQESFFNEKKEVQGKSTLELKIHPQSPIYKKLNVEAERLFADVEDQDLKKILVSIYIQSFNS
jgi:hypothetical protein